MQAKFRFFLSSILTAVIFGTFPVSAICDIYIYVDDKGVMHFTNVPASASIPFRLFIKESPSSDVATRSTDRAGSVYSSNTSLYDRYIAEAAKRYGISISLIKAIIKAESNFDPWAVSKKGALGLMQIMPQNLKSLKIKDPFDPEQNIMGGVQYFKQLLKRFDDNLRLAIAAYNAGPENVEQYDRIPPFKETEHYVRRVLQYYDMYRES
ncbi:MAG: transglycosylase SLT domain-containing protein [Deltaproteobacteria bacterium]|nr:transglycosylase SLT domain-containing protein [Deltaproteobacteria bacterium]MBW2150967.1 transglycosylase SLT domain-containing protein [Deltaproteobacteria bacterium]